MSHGETYYRFLSSATKNVLKTYGKEMATYENLDDIIGKLVFKETQQYTDMVKRYVLESDFYPLYLFDETRFWLEEGVYAGRLFEAVGKTDFSGIFKEYSLDE